jgi:hypothetical protein
MKYLISLLAFPVMYLFGAFVNWNFDAGAWHEGARMVTAIAGFFFALLGWQIMWESGR